ncbi:MAG: hypothetical protein ACREMN_06725 [Gemmatimonadales bacterium]
MKPRLGISIGAGSVRAVVVTGDRITWAGVAEWHEPPDLEEAVARLAAETTPVVRRARIVLERATIQTRSLLPAPPLQPGAVRRYVALEAPRLFRKNGAPLVTDAAIVPVDRTVRALWAAAVAEPIVQSALAGCAEAGLAVDDVGPAADVLPLAVREAPSAGELVLSDGTVAEVLAVGAGGTWRSRLVPGTRASEVTWVAALEAMGADAAHFAAAYGAGIARPRLSLLPPDTRAARAAAARRRALRVAAAAAALWLLAAGVHIARLYVSSQTAAAELAKNGSMVDSTLVLRRELDAGRRTLAQFGTAERARSRQLALLAPLTAALGDSAYLVMLRLGPDGTVRLAGYAPSAARVVADLERVRELREVRLDGPVTREQGARSRELDRFAVIARRATP